MRCRRRFGHLAAAVLITFSASPLTAIAFTVNSTADREDAVPGDGFCRTGAPQVCTLRAAIQEANALVGKDKITLPAGRYAVTRIPGVHGSSEVGTGDFDVLDGLILEGAGADRTIIDGNGIERVLDIVFADGTEIRDLTLTGGVATVPRNPDYLAGGAFVHGESTVVFERCRIVGNRAGAGGGLVVDVDSTVEIVDSLIEGNRLEDPGDNFLGRGAGILGRGGNAQLILRHSTVTGNTCPPQRPECFGGVSLTCGTPPLVQQIQNTTISGNDSIGIWTSSCDLEIKNSTIALNGGTGLLFNSLDNSNVLTMHNTIVADNVAGDCFWAQSISTDVAGGHNLASDFSCRLEPSLGDLPNTPPALRPLAYSGGLTPSHRPRASSPAIDTGRNDLCLATDQDHYGRPEDGDGVGGAICDIGALEVLECIGSSNVIIGGVLPTGVYESCTWLETAAGTQVNGTPVEFVARDEVILGNGLAVVSGSTFVISLDRGAGSGS